MAQSKAPYFCLSTLIKNLQAGLIGASLEQLACDWLQGREKRAIP
jgi:hypothetical protein